MLDCKGQYLGHSVTFSPTVQLHAPIQKFMRYILAGKDGGGPN